MRAANLRGLSGLAAERGLAVQALLERHGLDPELLEDPDAFLDCRAFAAFLEGCAERLGRPFLGLELAARQAPEVYGLVAAACRAAPSLRAALCCFVRYLPVVHSTESVLELVEGRELAELRWRERTAMGANEQANYQGLVLNLRLLRVVVGSGLPLARVGLPRAMFRRAVPPLAGVLRCPVRVGEGPGHIAFPKAWLEAPNPNASAILFALLEGLLARLAGTGAGEEDFAARVRAFLASRLGCGDVSLQACARHFGMAARTLQWHLKRAGTSHSALLEAVRLERARELLAATHLPVAEIADRLGYRERASFGRAFRRAFGLSPVAYRQSARPCAH